MAKYDVYKHTSGDVKVGDIIAAFVPSSKGRVVTQAEVVKINRTSIKAKYWDKAWYEVLLKDHQWYFILPSGSIVVDSEVFADLYRDGEILQKLLDAGVDNWEGWDMAIEEVGE